MDIRTPFQRKTQTTGAPGVLGAAHPISDLDLQMRTVGGMYRMRASLARELANAATTEESRQRYAVEADTWENAANLLAAKLEKREGKTS